MVSSLLFRTISIQMPSISFPLKPDFFAANQFNGSRVAPNVLKCEGRKLPQKSNGGTIKLQRSLSQHNYITARPCNRKCAVNATSDESIESVPSKDSGASLYDAIDAFRRFSRPHTVIGTVLSIISVSLLAVEKFSDITPLFFTGMMEAIVTALMMNIYIVGLNQLSDIEIDKVNKPYLPLASGEYSVRTAIVIISSSAIMSLLLGLATQSWPLFWALFISFILGTAYSVNSFWY